MVALVIMAIVAMLASQAFHTASSSAAATREAMDRLAKIDRTFFLIEQDLRNAIPKFVKPEFGQPLPPLFAALRGNDYWLTVMRGGFANPLFQQRTEEVRVGYRFIDDEIWRDVWYNPQLTDQDDARQTKLLDHVEDMNLRILATNAGSLAAGPWLQDWPPSGGDGSLPLAIEVTLKLEDMGEIIRLFSLLPGHGGPLSNGNNGNNDGNNGNPNSDENGNDGNPAYRDYDDDFEGRDESEN